jgi:hypothetical protein
MIVMDNEFKEELKTIGKCILLGFLLGLIVVYVQGETIREQIHNNAISGNVLKDGDNYYRISLLNMSDYLIVNSKYTQILNTTNITRYNISIID